MIPPLGVPVVILEAVMLGLSDTGIHADIRTAVIH